MSLMRFEPFEAGDGELWIHPEHVRRITKEPNRRSAARIVYETGDYREAWFVSKATPEEAAAAVNAALLQEPE